MGFYIRKSIKAGPFRFNLSKSGLGVSAGVPGFRVGTGPRGNYVNMGRHGVYYRATLGSKHASRSGSASRVRQPRPAEYRPSGIVMEDVTGSTVVAMEPTAGGDVVEQLNAAAARFPVAWPTAVVAFLIGLLAGMPQGIVAWVVLAPVCVWLFLWDQARGKVVLFYDVGDEPADWFTSVVEQWKWLSGSQKLWREVQAGAVRTTYQFKTNSGANSVVSRIAAIANNGGPKQLATNISVPSITAGKAALYFLPDRVLVRDGKRFSDVGYAHLGVRAGETRFIESVAPPGDAIQVDHTWQYVNVKGGPDRRFANNRLLPVMLYGTLDLSSAQGLRWDLQVSRRDAATPVAKVLSSAPTSTQTRRPTPTTTPPTPPISAPKHRKPDPVQPPEPARPAGLIITVEPSKPEPFPARRDPGFIRAQLTRKPTRHPATAATFTAIDVETTGLDPSTDRIVEIGLVKFTADGTVIDEFATLVNNPGSSADARAIHGIEDADLLGAPSTEQVLREAFAFMTGTVLVAHKLDFEDGFLTAAAHRAQIPLPRVIGVCTWQTSRRQLDGRAFSLTVMYKTATGGWQEHKHTALGDARAVRDVFLWLLRTSPAPLYLTQRPPAVVPSSFQQCPISCRPVPVTRSSVAALLDSFPQSSKPRAGDPAEIEKYHALLAEAVEDGRLTYEEASALTAQARLTRLTGTQLRELHQQAWDAAFPDEKDVDWASLAPVRRREMFLLADSLGLAALADRVTEVIQACAEPEPAPEARYLRGLRVAIVGDHSEVIELRKRAESYGAKLAVNITKTVQWMVTTAPDTTDSRHTTARTLGIPIISPAEGTVRLDEAIREAELKAFERQRQIDEFNASCGQREAEADAYWRPTWRPSELDHDSEYEPWYG
jgi:DNA polymerase III epsilon subunit-like protein